MLLSWHWTVMISFMKTIRLPILISLIFLFSISSVCAWTGKVVGVSDGDTIKVLQKGEQVKIRLYGVDTPEKAQAYGNAAKKFTSDMVAGKVVDVESVTIDRYGRTIGLVTINGELLGRELVRSGYAWVYRKYCDQQPLCRELIELESLAKQSGLGLWADSNPIPPWEWRHNGKKQTSVDREVESGSFHGNVKSHVFHQPGCKHYNCQNCTEMFTKKDAAIKAGYRPCGMCKP